jgi:hypothetical protein
LKFSAISAPLRENILSPNQRGSCPVAGPPGDHLPHALIELVAVLRDGEILAAHRAAYGDHPSTEVEHGFLAAGPALHKDLKKILPQRTERENKSE